MTNEEVFMPLLGGLGNQLFQYFAGNYISEIYGKNIVFITSHPSVRRNSRNLVAITDMSFTKKSNFVDFRFDNLERKFLSLAIRCSTGQENLNNMKNWASSTYLNSKRFQNRNWKLGIPENLGFTDISRFKGKTLIVGYFQTFRYFDEITQSKAGESWYKEISSTMSKLVNRKSTNEIRGTLLHIRRGDYLGENFGILSSGYYERALSEISRVGKVGNIYLISDGTPDDRFLLSESLSKHVRYIDTSKNSAAEVLALISRFRNVIVANSSLSWWGAKLGEFLRFSEVVVAPEPWFQGVNPPKYIVPDNWKVVKGDIWVG